MSNLTLGEAPDRRGIRDAVHVAVVSAIARTEFYPGEAVCLSTDGTEVLKRRGGNKAIGVIDPFRMEGVGSGDLVLVVLNPGTTKNLRHTWDHPEMSSEPSYDYEDADDGCRGC